MLLITKCANKVLQTDVYGMALNPLPANRAFLNL
jgi:hypothetical protein